jgi:hypothetical protein
MQQGKEKEVFGIYDVIQGNIDFKLIRTAKAKSLKNV